MDLIRQSNFTEPVICEDSRYKEGLASIVVTHLSLTLAIIGIMANLLTLIVLRRDQVRGSTNLLLATLATEDILIIISYSLYYVAIHYYENYDLIFLGYLKYADSPIQFVLSWVKVTEIYTIVLLSLQRYVAIRWPFRTNRLCSVGRTKRCLIGIFILSGLLKLPNLIFDYRIMEPKPNCELGTLKELFGQEPWYDTFKIVYIQVLDQVATFIIPSAILVLLNIGLILRVRQTSHQKLCEDSFDSIRSRSLIKHSSNQLNQSCPKYDPCQSQSTPKHPNSYKHQSNSYKQPNRTNSPFQTKFSRNWSTSIAPTSNSTGSTNQSHGHSVTLALIGVISTFLLFETPTTICFAYEFWTTVTSNKTVEDPSRVMPPTMFNDSSVQQQQQQQQQPHPEFQADFYYYAYPAALVCILSGCASNFFIYMLIGSRFRRLCFLFLKETFCKSWTHKTTLHHKPYPQGLASNTVHPNQQHKKNRRTDRSTVPIKRSMAIRERHKRSENPSLTMTTTSNYFELPESNDEIRNQDVPAIVTGGEPDQQAHKSPTLGK